MKKLKVFSISAILIAICCSFLFSASVSAASKKRNKFDHKPSGNIYYYDENDLSRSAERNIILMKRESSKTAGRRSREIIISSRSATAVMPPW